MKQFLKEIFTSQQYDEKNFFLMAGPCVVENYKFPLFLKPLIAKPIVPVAILLPALVIRMHLKY